MNFDAVSKGHAGSKPWSTCSDFIILTFVVVIIIFIIMRAIRAREKSERKRARKSMVF